MVDLIAVVLIFGTPLAAIGAFTALRLKRMQLEGGAKATPELERRLLALEGENRELRGRVETLETIATSGDHRAVSGARELEEIARVAEVAARR